MEQTVVACGSIVDTSKCTSIKKLNGSSGQTSERDNLTKNGSHLLTLTLIRPDSKTCCIFIMHL